LTSLTEYVIIQHNLEKVCSMASTYALITLVAGNLVSHVNFDTYDECATTKIQLLAQDTYTIDMACIAGSPALSSREATALMVDLMSQMQQLINRTTDPEATIKSSGTANTKTK
jgi:hypothetical protein